jgi:phosphatidylserine decarboxylase
MIRKEVIPYLAGGLFAGFVSYLLFKPLVVIFFVLCLFFLYFFRDPERNPPAEPDFVVSPADGKVIVIRQDNESFCPDGYTEIGIFMSPLDVHVNRVPFDGVVKEIIYTPGKFFSAFKEKAYKENENIKLTLQTQHGNIVVRQVAGSIARRAVCWVKEGQSLKKGERFGMIKFSSRVDICLPSYFKIQVNVGDKVKAGKTVIASLQ